MENPPSAQRNIGSTNTRSSISRTASVDRINYNDQSTSIQSVQQLTQELAKVSATAYKLPWEVNKAKAIKGTPKIPTWAQERPFFTEFPFLHNNLRTLKEDKDAKIIASVPLSKLPSQLHEHRLMEDILTVMSGIEGTYIKFVEGKPTFNIDTELDSSLINLINRILPIAIHYMNIARYVEKHNGYESGLFTHAFCAAINSIIREYYLLIAQLESQLRKGDLTLQKFLFFIQPSLKTLQTLDNLTQEVFNHIGGDLLNLIYLKSTALSGDKQIQDLTHFLLQKTSLPFFEMLQKWIYHGIIEDNYNEFFIEEHEEFQKEKLNEDYNDEECDGNDIKSTITELISFTTNEREYQDKVDVAFQFASKTLLDLLIHSKQLIPRLRSLKHYFFLDQGDFFVHFMDASFEELSKQVTDITPSKLDSLLELSLRTSISESDPFKDDLHCVLLPYTLLNHLLKIIHVVHGAVHVNSTLMKQQQQQQADQSKLNYSKVNGFDAFSFDFKVQFPVSLVISRKALTKYQLIFRFLFFCKYVERQLCKAWTQHQSMKELDLKIALATSYSMRQRMLQFVQNVEYYIMCEVLEPNWQSLEENIRKASSIDDILDCHDRFLDNCLHQCMLTDQRLVQVITRLMVTCTTFANFTDLYIRTLKVEDSGLNTSISSDSISKLDKETLDQQKQIRNQVIREQALKVAKDKSFQNTLGKFEVKFNGAMKQLIDLLQLQSFSKYQLANLAMRLDYSGYYALYFEKNPHLVGPTNLATPLSASKKD